MTTQGVRTPNMPLYSVSDELLVNRGRSTGLQTTEALAVQLTASGAIARAFAAVEARVTSGLILKRSWAELLDVTPDADGTSLPILASCDTLIGGIPGLAAWHSARPEYLTLDEAGRALSWTPRAGSGAWTAIGAGKRPRFAAGQLNGQGGLMFDRSRLDGMVWGGARPVGAGALWSTVVVARVAPDPAIQFLLGRSGAAGISLYVGTDGSLRSYQ